MTLSDLTRMARVVSIRRLAMAAGINAMALRQRIRRGTPALNDSEIHAIKSALDDAGLMPTSPPPKTTKAP